MKEVQIKTSVKKTEIDLKKRYFSLFDCVELTAITVQHKETVTITTLV